MQTLQIKMPYKNSIDAKWVVTISERKDYCTKLHQLVCIKQVWKLCIKHSLARKTYHMHPFTWFQLVLFCILGYNIIWNWVLIRYPSVVHLRQVKFWNWGTIALQGIIIWGFSSNSISDYKMYISWVRMLILSHSLH